MSAPIVVRRGLDALPPYSVLVRLDDDTDVRVKTSGGGWSVSRRFADQAIGDTGFAADYYGFRLVHKPATSA